MRLPLHRASAPASRPRGVPRPGRCRARLGLPRRHPILRPTLLPAVLVPAVLLAVAATTSAAAGARLAPNAALANPASPPGHATYADVADAANTAGADGTDGITALRRDLLRLLNDRRAAAGAPPLRLAPALDSAAQRHVDDVVAAGSLLSDHRPEQAMEQRLRDLDYEAHQWAENLMRGPATAAQLVTAWSGDDSDGTFRRLLDPAYVDLGVGIGRLDGAPLYSILFAVPESAVFERESAALRDRERVRAELLTRINAERRRAGGRPLTLDFHLDLAAQRHADDMLAHSFFAHRGSDGETVRQRASEAGYRWSAIGENLAEGQESVQEAVESWMRSAGHRENVLGNYTQTGIGLTLGRDPKTGEYRILWVQTFGLPR